MASQTLSKCKQRPDPLPILGWDEDEIGGGREHHSGVPQPRVLQNTAIGHPFPQSKPVPRTPFIQDSLLEGPGMYGSGTAVWPLPQRVEVTFGEPSLAGLKVD